MSAAWSGEVQTQTLNDGNAKEQRKNAKTYVSLQYTSQGKYISQRVEQFIQVDERNVKLVAWEFMRNSRTMAAGWWFWVQNDFKWFSESLKMILITLPVIIGVNVVDFEPQQYNVGMPNFVI